MCQLIPRLRDIPFSPHRGRAFESIKSMKARTAAPKAPLFHASRPPLSSGFFFGGGGGPPPALNTTKAFFGAIEGARRPPAPPPAPLMVFTRAPAAPSEAPAGAPRRAKKLFWPVWRRNQIVWVRTPPPPPPSAGETTTAQAPFVRR